MNRDLETHAVDASRLALGRWDTDSQKELGEGDIAGSYSADKIGMGQPIRRPFTWRGGLWICTAIDGSGDAIAVEAYRLVDPDRFRGAGMSYAEKTRDAEAARNHPMGFYHGVTIVCRGRTMVLGGPPVRLVAGQCEPATLFDAVKTRESKTR